MNQRNSQNISHESRDVNLVVGNLTQNKNETMININVSIKNQQHIVHMKKVIFDILVYVLGSIIEDCVMGDYFKDCECVKSLIDGLIATCDDIEDTP